MLVNTVLNKWTEGSEPLEFTVELIVFDICEVSFGIPITKLDRIVSGGQLGQDHHLTQNVQTLDLHHRLSGKTIGTPAAIAIFTGEDRVLYGIPIETFPTVIAVPLDRIRVLPSDFRATNPLGIASHIALILDPIVDATIFILA